MKAYSVRYRCSGCNIDRFPMLIIADNEKEARKKAQAQADLDCDQTHTILSVEEAGYEPNPVH